MIEDFQHLSITCKDLEKSTRFYELLGLSVTEPVSEFDEAVLAQAFGLNRGHIKVLHLAPANAESKLFIDLVQFLDPASAGVPYPALNHVGINRFALRVSDIDATTRALREKGITFLSQESQSFGPIRTIVTTDPDGIFVQLLEWL